MNSIDRIVRQASTLLQITSPSPALDAEVLMSFVLQKQRSYLRAWPNKMLTSNQCTHFWNLLEQRARGTPIAYLMGEREFWSRDFIVTPDVLIPRPETEQLVELTLARIPKHSSSALHVIDLGTGSGAIAVTLAVERPAIQVTATDSSLAALHIAQQNAQRHQAHNIRFQHSFWFEQLAGTVYDIVVSNPPYIAENDPHLQQGDVRFEPNSALLAGPQGLADITRIADSARKHIKTNGWLLLEHGYDQEQQVQEIFKSYNYRKIETFTDLSGLPRITLAQPG